MGRSNRRSTLVYHGGSDAVGGDSVGVGARQSLDDPVEPEPEPSQVIGHQAPEEEAGPKVAVDPGVAVGRSRSLYNRVEFRRNGWTFCGLTSSSDDRSACRGRSQTPCQGEGRGFESRLPLHQSRSGVVFELDSLLRCELHDQTARIHDARKGCGTRDDANHGAIHPRTRLDVAVG
jgi:hypothetical protein